MIFERDTGDEHVDMNGYVLANSQFAPDGTPSWMAWRDEAHRLMDEVDKLRYLVETLQRNNKVLEASLHRKADRGKE